MTVREFVNNGKGQGEMMTAKETAAVEYYCNAGSDSYNNWCASFAAAGYSQSGGWQTNAIHVLHKDHVKLAISEYKASIKQNMDWDRDKAVAALTTDYEYLNAKAKEGNIQAIQARAAIARELSAISGLHRTEAAAQAMQINIHLPDKDEG